MNIKIESNFQFSVAKIQYSATGELCITLNSDKNPPQGRFLYTASLGTGQAEEKPIISLLQYTRKFAASANIKPNTKDFYRLMCNHLDTYGDITIDKVTTAYLQDFIQHLQSQGLKPGSVRLYFHKLACVLHDAYKNGLFDDRILQRVKRPKREQGKKCVLLLTKEVPIYTVQQLMCHSDIGSTKVYADLLNKTKEKAVRKPPTFTC